MSITSTANLRSVLIFTGSMSCAFIYAQPGFVTLPGRYFELDGAPYYPRVMNYGMDFASYDSGSTDPSDIMITPSGAYDRNIHSHYEHTTGPALIQQAREHFQYLASIGFNAIRLHGALPVMYWENNGNGPRHYGLEVKALPEVDPRYMIELSTPAFDDPISGRMFELLRQIIQVADEEGLKTILLCADDHPQDNDPSTPEFHLATDQAAVDLYADYLFRMATELKDEPGLLAYDLWNEPIWTDYALVEDLTKTQVCEYTSRWYDAIRAAGDRHLVTLGGASYDEVRTWDPAVMKIDFYSPHVYPLPLRALGYGVENAMKVYEAHMHWLGRTCPIPWLIGETGFSAEDDEQDPLDFITGPDNQHLDPVANGHHQMPWMMGSETQQAEFAQRSMDATRNAKGSGYSWWGFQNTRGANLNSDAHSYMGNWWGPLKFGNEAGIDPSLGGTAPPPWDVEHRWRPKQMVQTLINHQLPPAPEGIPELPDNYYNLYGLTSPVVYDGYVEDQEEGPVADAVVSLVHRYVHLSEDPELNYEEWHRSITDENGYFTFKELPSLSGFQPPVIDPRSIEGTGFASISLGPSGSSSIVDRQLLPYSNTVGPIVVLNGMDEDFRGRMELEVQGGVVGWGTGGGIADLYAGNSVHVTGHFHADSDAELHIFNQPTFPECLEGGPKNLILAGPVSTSARVQKSAPNAVQLRFQKVLPALTVFPIPATDLLHVVTDVHAFDYVMTDAAGRLVLKGWSDMGKAVLDVSGLAVGRYEFRITQNGASNVTSISIAR